MTFPLGGSCPQAVRRAIFQRIRYDPADFVNKLVIPTSYTPAGVSFEETATTSEKHRLHYSMSISVLQGTFQNAPAMEDSALDKFEQMWSAERKIEKKSCLMSTQTESPFQQAISHSLSCRDPPIIFKFW
jgi:hypothetical protein